MGISLFGWLDRIPFWRDLPYHTKGALLRALKAGLAVAVGILLTAATAGALYPADWGPMVTITVTAILQAIDKFVREWQVAREGAEVVTDEPAGPDGE